MHQWHEQGLFRRIGLVLNHRALGFTANAMLVLDVPDALIDEVGQRLGRAPGITLCYQRPRRLPQWHYNLFCMIHGRQRDQVEAQIQALLKEHLLDDLPHELLFSTHAFKQCGGRFAPLPTGAPPVDDLDRRLINRLQLGLPLVRQPWKVLAEELESSSDELLDRLHLCWKTACSRASARCSTSSAWAARSPSRP